MKDTSQDPHNESFRILSLRRVPLPNRYVSGNLIDLVLGHLSPLPPMTLHSLDLFVEKREKVQGPNVCVGVGTIMCGCEN